MVRCFYGFYSDVLPGAIGLVMRLRWWRDEEGLQLEDCRAALKELMKPASAKRFTHKGELLAGLSEAIENAIKWRRKIERTQRDRMLTARGNPADMKLLAALKSVGENP